MTLLTADYFTLFGLPQQFALEDAALQQAYVRLQQETHPDRMVGADQQTRAQAAQASARVNDGYQTLKDPLKRAEYLLSLQGIIVNRDNSTITPDQTLLMEAMEQREALAAAETAKAIAALQQEHQQQQQACLDRLAALLASETYEEAAHATIRLHYCEKFGREIKLKQKTVIPRFNRGIQS